MVKKDEFIEAPQTTSCSEEFGTDTPTPGHTDDEASDEEGGQTPLASDDEINNATTGDQLTTRQWTRQDGLGFARRCAPRQILKKLVVAS